MDLPGSEPVINYPASLLRGDPADNHNGCEVRSENFFIVGLDISKLQGLHRFRGGFPKGGIAGREQTGEQSAFGMIIGALPFSGQGLSLLPANHVEGGLRQGRMQKVVGQQRYPLLELVSQTPQRKGGAG